MASLQPKSIKITKKAKETTVRTRTFACGGCSRAYGSYPALYLHIKRKHNGIKPPNTKTLKSLGSPFEGIMQTGRPHKPVCDIDDVSEFETNLESVQNAFFHFLGERLLVVNEFALKPKMENIVNKVMEISKRTKDQWLDTIQAKIQEYSVEFNPKFTDSLEIELDDDTKDLDPNDTLKALVWFVLWLAKYFVKLEFIPDLCVFISRVWKVLDELQLCVKDLDNKLVWKKVVKEIDAVSKEFVFFKGDQELLSEFVQLTCQLIDRSFKANIEE